MDIKENLAGIEKNIKKSCEKSDRNIKDINIIAVTKYVSDKTVQEALSVGITNFAENRDTAYNTRKEKFKDATWHLIGSLQTRKVRDVINNVDYFHALDRKSLADEIEKRATKVIECFVQVNVSEEESKHGLKIEELEQFINLLKDYKNIRVIGLMTMAPFTEDESFIRSCFRKLRELRDSIEKLNIENIPCHYLSMGMSNDYTIAVEEGATHIRLGTSLVGDERE